MNYIDIRIYKIISIFYSVLIGLGYSWMYVLLKVKLIIIISISYKTCKIIKMYISSNFGINSSLNYLHLL
jgi:hypothetical protein